MLIEGILTAAATELVKKLLPESKQEENSLDILKDMIASGELKDLIIHLTNEIADSKKSIMQLTKELESLKNSVSILLSVH